MSKIRTMIYRPDMHNYRSELHQFHIRKNCLENQMVARLKILMKTKLIKKPK